MNTATVNNLIEEFIQLPLEDKEYATEVIKKQLIDAKREAIAKRAKTAMAGFRKKTTKHGTVKTYTRIWKVIKVSWDHDAPTILEVKP